jgi:pyruvate-formate lyase
MEKKMPKLNVKKKSEDEYVVQSHSDTSIWYYVNIKNKSCTCLHYKMRLRNIGSTCKHYDDLVKYLNKTILKKIPKYVEIENVIKLNNNFVDYDEISNKFGDEIIEEMLKIGRLVQLRRGKLSVM